MQKVINVFNELPKEVIESQSTDGRSGGRGEETMLLQARRRQGEVQPMQQCCSQLRKTGGHGSCPWSILSKGRSECISQI